MKNKAYIFLMCLFASLIAVTACAHRSGQKKRERKTHKIEEEQKDENPNTDKPIANVATGHHTKLEGAEVFQRYSKAIFMVFTSDGSNVYQGSGFFIGNCGLAVSNYHVFRGTDTENEVIKVYGDDTAYKVEKIYAQSEAEDFVLFRVAYNNKTAIPLASERPKIGDKVFTIGSPRGLENTFSSGEVSQWRDTNLMQISALIDHGSSGGALINEYGEAVGITSGTFAEGSQANLNYAWSIEVVKPYLK